ncbi:hypothetical protein SPI_06871 [Niveomyces insectorum RCEF 264]|uniref:Secreted protein n=1 Tax=Niveomyces insectorum RCEF 264 TaxID=1081102 RepID=A0A167QUS1_9HYPO|nr:hypothetical protein SPI_06871 [Niveomyces insectorum RCEF 264]
MHARRSLAALLRCASVVVVLAGLASVPTTTGAHAGACIKLPTHANSRDMRYHMRIPHGQRYNRPDEPFPGKAFYDVLEICRVANFTTVYDEEGNAHVDFVLKDKWFKFFPNLCDVPKRIHRACKKEFMPRCPVGTPAMLAAQWRKGATEKA